MAGAEDVIVVGAGLAGPAVMISFALAGLVCACAALAYAEMATMMPQPAAPIPTATSCWAKRWPGSLAGA